MATPKIAATCLMGVLAAGGRSAEIPESADCYGWLAGGWRLDVRNYWGDVRALGLTAEAHFGWVLEGRAVQDVWILPVRDPRTGEIDRSRKTQGTTLRVWDSALQAWRVTWISPLTGARVELVGRWSQGRSAGRDRQRDADPLIFRDHAGQLPMDGETLQADGHTWKLEGEFPAADGLSSVLIAGRGGPCRSRRRRAGRRVLGLGRNGVDPARSAEAFGAQPDGESTGAVGSHGVVGRADPKARCSSPSPRPSQTTRHPWRRRRPPASCGWRPEGIRRRARP